MMNSMWMPMARLEQKPIDLGVFRYHIKIMFLFLMMRYFYNGTPIIRLLGFLFQLVSLLFIWCIYENKKKL